MKSLVKEENINIGKRHGFDFTDHVHEIIQDEYVRIDKFKKPNTFFDSIYFINTCGIMTVTGDYNNWVFCREFIPSEINGVSDMYWDEKLRIASSQNSHLFCQNETSKNLNEKIKELEVEKDEFYNSLIEYYKDCLNHIDSEFFYTSYAYDNLPDGYDYEYIIKGEVRDIQLSYIYDAFDVICKRLKQKENDNK